MDTEILSVERKLPSEIPGLDDLSQALLETSEIEECSICLENIQDTVVLWPCSHLFCKRCISNWQASATGGKASCPLCKSSAARRSVLDFEAEQKKRADILQRLVGAISLDLGFDITTYKRSIGSDQPNIHAMDQISSSLSPVKKTIRRSFDKDVKIKKCTITRKRGTRHSERLKTSNADSPKILLTVANLPTEVFEGDMRERKVKEWLDATKFSQVGEDHLKETVVVDVHVPDSELTAFSEEQLKSVTQVDCESSKKSVKLKPRIKFPKSSPDLDDIRPFDETNEFKFISGVKKTPNKNTTLMPDEFDELLPLKKKGQLVKSTYGGKTQSSSNRRSKRIFPVESDIFKSVVEPVHQNTESEFVKLVDPSQATLEDFSSGSGEEWVADLEKEQSLKYKKNHNNHQNDSDDCLEMKFTRRSSRLAKQDISESVDKSKSKKLKFTERNHSKSKSSSSNIAKILETAFPNNKCQNLVEKITGDWFEVDCSESDIRPTEQAKEFKKRATCNKLFDSVEKSMPIQRSPGWSRLTTTKKEFHMSEKKKLSLKTLNSSISRSMTDITPVCVQDQSLVESSKQSSNVSVASKSPRPLKENVKQGLNKSVDSSVSPFKGFLTPKVSNNCKSWPKLKRDSISLCNLTIAKEESFADSNHHTIVRSDLSKSGLNSTEPSSNTDVVCDKSKDLVNLSETKLKTNSLDLKSTSNVNETLPFIPSDYEIKSSTNSLVDVELNHLPIPVLNEENIFIDCKNNEMDRVVNFPSASCNQTQKSNINDDEINNTHCPQDDREERLGHQIVTEQIKERKRSREDPAVNSISSPPTSPLRKRFCKDVEVQTSPSQIKRFIDDYIKNVYGIENVKLIEFAANNNKSAIGKPEHLSSEDRHCKVGLFKESGNNNTKGNQEHLSQSVKESNIIQDFKSAESGYCKTSLSQDSDKENNCLSLADNISDKFLNDSDIVLGTEDWARNSLRIVDDKFKCPKMQTKPNLSVLENIEMKEENEVDPNCATQPYKTPVGPKQTLQATTSHVFSAVSNPTDSELKKVNDVFLVDKILFPDDTPKSVTPWNSSGIKELESYTIKINKDVDLIYKSEPSKKNKSKYNKSRRQLDFIEEDSQSSDMFDTIIEKDVVNEKIESKEKNCLVKIDSVSNEDDDIFVVYEKKSQSEKPTTKQPVNNVLLNKCSVISNTLQSAIVNNTSNVKTQVNTCFQDRVLIPRCNQFKCNVESKTKVLCDKDDISRILQEFNVKNNSSVSLTSVASNTNQINSCIDPIKKPNTFKKNTPKEKHHSTLSKCVSELVIHVDNEKSVTFQGITLHKQTPLKMLIALNNKIGHLSEQSAQDTLVEGSILDVDQLSNASSVDCFIQGTPEVSPTKIQSWGDNEQPWEEQKKQSSFTELEENIKHATRYEKENVSFFRENQDENYFSAEKHQEYKPTALKENNTEQSKTILSEDFGETEEPDLNNYCFSSSLLNSVQNKKLQLVLDSSDIPFSRTINANTSHLVVGTVNGRTQNTFKYLYAMAQHQTIISFDWVEEVMKQAGQTVSMDPYLALDPSGECGVLRAKQDKERILLQDFAVHIYNVTPQLVTKEQIEELVQLCGGTVVSSLSQFLTVPRDKFRIIVYSEPPDTLTQTDQRRRYSAAEVSIEWIYNTVGRYRVVPLLQFMIDQTNAVPFLRHQGYPEDLIFDPPTQQ